MFAVFKLCSAVLVCILNLDCQPLSMGYPWSHPNAPAPIRVATVNVRYDTHWNERVPVPESGVDNPKKLPKNQYAEQAWTYRRSRLVDALLGSGDLDIIGFQEVLHNQLVDLAALLGPRFDHVGVGRNDGKRAGEYSPIFYDKERFSLVRWHTIWLSETPEVPSRGWDADQTRIATLLTVRDKSSGSLVHAVCTHYDHIGLTARAESSLLIRKTIRRWILEAEGKITQSPVLLFGDFNSPDSETGYKNIVSRDVLDGSRFTFQDAYTCLQTRCPERPGLQSRPYGPKCTYTGFDAPGQNDETTRIDFIMLGTNENGHSTHWRFSQYAVIDNWIEEGDESGWVGRWSDHRAVRATIVMDKEPIDPPMDARTLFTSVKFMK